MRISRELGTFSIAERLYAVDLTACGFETNHTLGFSGGGAAAILDYWVTRRVGIRTEVRDHIYSDEGSVPFLGPRIGVVIRGK